MELTFSSYYTLFFATIVLLLGRWMNQHLRWLREFNIPEPVAGGLVAATVLFTLHHQWGYTFHFSAEMQTAFMLVFFSSIGLGASFSKLRQGGIALLAFTVVVTVFIIVQNLVGVSLARLLGLDPLIGLIAGSITLVGGHGTAGAWGQVLENDYGIRGAVTLGIACATFGLVIGGLIGGPLAKALITRDNLSPTPARPSQVSRATAQDSGADTEFATSARLISVRSAIETLALFAGCLAFAEWMTGLSAGTFWSLPTFVWALLGGVILRNTLDYVFHYQAFDRAVDVFGNASLSIYLAIALLSLKLWELSGLAAPLMLILVLQTVTMAVYAVMFTFRTMGSDYDAAVLAAGHCGFGMGATPTAVANMQAVTNRYGPSYKAFLIVPMVGAFFVDIANAALIQAFIRWAH